VDFAFSRQSQGSCESTLLIRRTCTAIWQIVIGPGQNFKAAQFLIGRRERSVAGNEFSDAWGFGLERDVREGTGTPRCDGKYPILSLGF
jgi:hypothetical protein